MVKKKIEPCHSSFWWPSKVTNSWVDLHTWVFGGGDGTVRTNVRGMVLFFSSFPPPPLVSFGASPWYYLDPGFRMQMLLLLLWGWFGLGGERGINMVGVFLLTISADDLELGWILVWVIRGGCWVCSWNRTRIGWFGDDGLWGCMYDAMADPLGINNRLFRIL